MDNDICKTLKQLNDKYKDDNDNGLQFGIRFENIDRIKFSSPLLNYMTYGGLPRGRIIEFTGLEGGGKTTTCLDLVKNAQETFPDKPCLYVDVERTLDKAWAEVNGVNTDELIVYSPPASISAEKLFDRLLDYIEELKPSICVIDSLGVLVSQQAFEKDIVDKTYGGISQALTSFVSKVIPVLARTNCMLIGINQQREDLSGFNQLKTPGGKAWKYACSVRMTFDRGKFVDANGNEVSSKTENPIGQKIVAKLVKTKICPLDRRLGEYTINYLTGIDITQDIVSLGMKSGTLQQAGGWYKVIDITTGEIKQDDGVDLKFHGIGQLKEVLETNVELKQYILKKFQ